MKVQDLLTDESKWTQESYAKNAKGNAVKWTSQFAVCWCLSGAVRKCYSDLQQFEILKKIRNFIKNKVGHTNIASFNDKATFQDICNLIEELDI